MVEEEPEGVSIPAGSTRHRWTGCNLACDEVGLLLSVNNVLHDSYLAFLVQLCRASKVAVMARTRMAMTTAMTARTRSLCKVTLKQCLMPTGAAD